MANTANFNLPLIDGSMTADVPRDMNALAEAVDANVRAAIDGAVLTVPDASTTQKGIVQLTNATDSTSETLAPTAKALKNAYDLASNALPKSGGTISGDVGVSGQIWVAKNTVYGNTTNLDLAMGDSDTGFDWVADGQIDFYSNAQVPVRLIQSDFQFKNTSGSYESLKQAIADLKSSVSNGKNDIASAIIDKGGSASGSDTFGQLAAAITSIPGKRVAVVDVNQLTTVIPINSRLDERSASLGFSTNGLGFTPGQFYAVVKIIETTESGADIGYSNALYGLIGYAPSLGVNLTVGTTYRNGHSFRASASDVRFGPGSCTVGFDYFVMLSVAYTAYFRGKLEKVVLIEQ